MTFFWLSGISDSQTSIQNDVWRTLLIVSRPRMNKQWLPGSLWWFSWPIMHLLCFDKRVSRTAIDIRRCFLPSFPVHSASGLTLLLNPLPRVHPHQHYPMWTHLRQYFHYLVRTLSSIFLSLLRNGSCVLCDNIPGEHEAESYSLNR